MEAFDGLNCRRRTIQALVVLAFLIFTVALYVFSNIIRAEHIALWIIIAICAVMRIAAEQIDIKYQNKLCERWLKQRELMHCRYEKETSS